MTTQTPNPPLEPTDLTHYQILNIYTDPRQITYEDIENAWDNLSSHAIDHFKSHWPHLDWTENNWKTSFDDCFSRVIKSHEILSNSKTRQEYDRSLGIPDYPEQLCGLPPSASTEEIKFDYRRIDKNKLQPDYWDYEILGTITTGIAMIANVATVSSLVIAETATSPLSEKARTILSYSSIITFGLLCFALAGYLYYRQRKICEQAKSEFENQQELADDAVKKNLSHVFWRSAAKWSCVISLGAGLAIYGANNIHLNDLDSLSSLANPNTGIIFADIFLLLGLVAAGGYFYNRYQVGPVLEVRSEAQQEFINPSTSS